MKRVVAQGVLLASIVGGSLLAAAPANATVFKNYANQNLCLSVKANVNKDGTDLIVWTCTTGDTNQNWSQTTFDSDYVQLHDGANTNECAALYNSGSTNDGNQAIIWSCSAGTEDQGWFLYQVDDGSNCYAILNEKAELQDGVFKGLSLNGNDNNNANVVLEMYYGYNDQIWCEY